MDLPEIRFVYNRRFGAEFEINAFDGRDFKKNPLDAHAGEMPKGSDHVAKLVRDNVEGENVEITKWGYNHGNNYWVIKPDSSCGIEICAPVYKGWTGIKKVCRVIQALKNDKQIKIDNRCSFHVHLDMSDCDMDNIGKVVAYWIKCESVFLDSVPPKRKRNKYCQQIGISDLFSHDYNIVARDLIMRLGKNKYYTINTYHLAAGRRQTIEFRIIEGEGCTDPYLVKNWVRLLIHFVERALGSPWPRQYSAGDPWSGLCWLDPIDVMKFLGFDGSYVLSQGMEQTRNWFLARLKTNAPQTGLSGIWSDKARKISIAQIDDLVAKVGIDCNKSLSPDNPEIVFSNEFKD
jgi:hypothetical protein